MSASDDFCFISVSGSCVLAKGRVTSFVIGLLKTDFFSGECTFFFCDTNSNFGNLLYVVLPSGKRMIVLKSIGHI